MKIKRARIVKVNTCGDCGVMLTLHGNNGQVFAEAHLGENAAGIAADILRAAGHLIKEVSEDEFTEIQGSGEVND